MQNWYVACASGDLGRGPRACIVDGTPLVLFRDASGRARALVDRCPHRNMPLSAARVVDGALQCSYHGWRFGSDGGCLEVPGLVGAPARAGRDASAVPVDERQELVWARVGEGEPAAGPHHVRMIGEAGVTEIRLTQQVRAPLDLALENILDVPHTAFLHRGLFRTGRSRTDVEVRVRRGPTSIEAEYVGEPRPSGLAGRILAPRGGIVRHFDRFILPCVAEVEYVLGERTRLLTTHLLTPVGEDSCVVRYVAAMRLELPGALVKPAILPFARRILRQDASALALQSENLRRFGGRSFASTELDVVGPHVNAMLEAARRGEPPPPASEWRLRMLV